MARRRKPEDDLAAASAHPPQVIPDGPNIDFATLMPGYRKRHDGWNQQRVQGVGYQSVTGLVGMLAVQQ